MVPKLTKKIKCSRFLWLETTIHKPEPDLVINSCLDDKVDAIFVQGSSPRLTMGLQCIYVARHD